MSEKLRPEDLEQYEILNHRYIEDLHSDSYLLLHKKTRARIALLPNDDNNKVFSIGFRTPPTDSTGVAHIIEHTVLCGSRDFPVKDPFIELAKGSLNTFLNAMTFPDKTVYPVASCNDKDFQNLMHVYLDAVFYPRIYKEKRIFEQEGWHYEMADSSSELTINGVVYNEMKGAMSSPDDMLERQIYNSLYPDTPYAHESGGDPDNIPDLTYENYLGFHSRYYHPSNSFIYLYGDMNMAEKLIYMDEKYLSNFDALDIDSAIPFQQPFEKVRTLHTSYSVMKGEDTDGQTYLSYNTAFPTGLDAKLNTAFKILDYCLCEAPGAPLKEALVKAGIGKDVYSMFENGIKQPYFSVVAKYAKPEDEKEFYRIIESTLSKLVKDGLDERSLLAGINYYEFRYRECDFGSYPKGLVFGLQALDSWLYDDYKPWLNLELAAIYSNLREEIHNGYFEKLIEKYILGNTHKSVLVMVPEEGLTERKDAELKAKLSSYASSLSAEQRDMIVENTKSLREYQEAPDSEENLAKIPLLRRKDLKKLTTGFANKVKSVQGVKVLQHPIYTNGIHYLNFGFDVKKLPAQYVPYLGVFKAVLGLLSTEKYSYTELNQEIHIATGGINGHLSVYSNVDDQAKYQAMFEVTVKVLDSHIEEALALVYEILNHTQFTDVDRMKEILEEEYSGMRSDLIQAGHVTASTRALSYFQETAAFMDDINGIGGYHFLGDLLSHYEEQGAALPEIFHTMAQMIFTKENLFIDVTAESKACQQFIDYVPSIVAQFPKGKVTGEPFTYSPMNRREGFQTAGQVQYVCRAGNYAKKGHPYTGALRVLKVIMGYDYLWNEVRVKGGAYGCMSSFAKDGSAFYVSYRDPHLAHTIEVFEQAAAYVREFHADERQMTQFIIGAVSTLDQPMTPAAYGRFSRTGYLTGLKKEQLQQERNEVLECNQKAIQALADYIKAFMEDDYLCVVGSSDKIKANERLFKTLDSIS